MFQIERISLPTSVTARKALKEFQNPCVVSCKSPQVPSLVAGEAYYISVAAGWLNKICIIYLHLPQYQERVKLVDRAANLLLVPAPKAATAVLCTPPDQAEKPAESPSEAGRLAQAKASQAAKGP